VPLSVLVSAAASVPMYQGTPAEDTRGDSHKGTET